MRTVIGSPQIMADQLRYLLELMDLSNVDIRVVPFSAGWTQAHAGAFILVESDEGPSIVNLEMQAGGLILPDRDDLGIHRRAADAVREKAMSSNATKELIGKALTELEVWNDESTRP